MSCRKQVADIDAGFAILSCVCLAFESQPTTADPFIIKCKFFLARPGQGIATLGLSSNDSSLESSPSSAL